MLAAMIDRNPCATVIKIQRLADCLIDAAVSALWELCDEVDCLTHLYHNAARRYLVRIGNFQENHHLAAVASRCYCDISLTG